jgi:hypothetical protein
MRGRGWDAHLVAAFAIGVACFILMVTLAVFVLTAPDTEASPFRTYGPRIDEQHLSVGVGTPKRSQSVTRPVNHVGGASKCYRSCPSTLPPLCIINVHGHPVVVPCRGGQR